MNVRNLRGRKFGVDADHENYKWWALSCTSLGMLLVTINSGTLIIALPDLERALGTSLLQLVWVILAYMIASTVLVLTAGRLSDLFGRKTAYVASFLIFSAASLLFKIFSGLAAGLSDAQLQPFIHNMHTALWVLAATSVIGAGVSLLRPRYEEQTLREGAGPAGLTEAGATVGAQR